MIKLLPYITLLTFCQVFFLVLNTPKAESSPPFVENVCNLSNLNRLKIDPGNDSRRQHLRQGNSAWHLEDARISLEEFKFLVGRPAPKPMNKISFENVCIEVSDKHATVKIGAEFFSLNIAFTKSITMIFDDNKNIGLRGSLNNAKQIYIAPGEYRQISLYLERQKGIEEIFFGSNRMRDPVDNYVSVRMSKLPTCNNRTVVRNELKVMTDAKVIQVCKVSAGSLSILSGQLVTLINQASSRSDIFFGFRGIKLREVEGIDVATFRAARLETPKSIFFGPPQHPHLVSPFGWFLPARCKRSECSPIVLAIEKAQATSIAIEKLDPIKKASIDGIFKKFMIRGSVGVPDLSLEVSKYPEMIAVKSDNMKEYEQSDIGIGGSTEIAIYSPALEKIMFSNLMFRNVGRYVILLDPQIDISDDNFEIVFDKTSFPSINYLKVPRPGMSDFLAALLKNFNRGSSAEMQERSKFYKSLACARAAHEAGRTRPLTRRCDPFHGNM